MEWNCQIGTVVTGIVWSRLFPSGSIAVRWIPRFGDAVGSFGARAGFRKVTSATDKVTIRLYIHFGNWNYAVLCTQYCGVSLISQQPTAYSKGKAGTSMEDVQLLQWLKLIYSI